MSSKLYNLAWFYRGKMDQSTVLSESLDHKIIYFLLVTSTVAGFLTIFTKFIQFVRLMLSLFVLPGKPVYLSLPVKCSSIRLKVVFPAPHIWPAFQNVGPRHGSFGWHWQGVCPSAFSRWLLHPSRVPHRQQTRSFSSRDQVQIQYLHQNPGHGLWSQQRRRLR